MILSGDAIRERLGDGQIFTKLSCVDGSVMEASYALRMAPDGMMLEGRSYSPGTNYPGDSIEIAPGKIAILSTIERLNMPGDLVGKLGIRFDYASKGLVGLMGIQVDPFFGWGHDDERLYIRVANLGNEPVPISMGAAVFTFELHKVEGNVPEPTKPRTLMWHRLRDLLGDQKNASWSYVTRVQSELSDQATEIDKRLESETKSIREYLQPVVMFGIFLVAVTILGVALATILGVRDTPEVAVPSWVTDWAWIILLFTLGIATITTSVMGAVMIWRLWKPK